ncbi:MAG: LuxR C-terminal-related transcriptional regulator [Bdellovibrionota bacterium]
MQNDNASNVIALNQDEEKGQVHRERKLTAVVLLVIAIFTLVDLVGDKIDGAPWSHVLSELALVVVASGLAAYLFKRAQEPLVRKNRLLERELTRAREDAVNWQNATRELRLGLSEAITKQFEEWKLSEAEQEIALLLLKGLSHKEIAEVRSTSEQTVRQQAGSLYNKSNLSGRNELSAFFLEDLLVAPVRKGETPPQ